MAFTPDLPVTGAVIEAAWGIDVRNAIAEIDPTGETEGYVLKVNSAGDGYDFGQVGSMKRTTGGGTYMIPAGPSLGTTLTSSASANTYGSWTQMVASAAADLVILGVVLRPNDLSTSRGYLQVDIGTGTAASESSRGEVKAASDVGTGGSSSTMQLIGTPIMLPAPIKISSGERIACRVADQEASGREIYVTLIVCNAADLENF